MLNATVSLRDWPRSAQRGQSMTEFLVSLAVLVPLFFAVTYAGKYADVQQTAIQASRYAAMQRAIEPQQARLSDAKIIDQTKVRFFVAGKTLNNGKLQSDDSVSKLKKGQGTPALWHDDRYNKLLAGADKVSVTFSGEQAMRGGALISPLAKTTTKQTFTGPRTAMVEVPLVNKMDQLNKNPAQLRLAAATAAVGNRWTSGGNADTVDNVQKTLVTSALEFLNPILSFGTWFFEGSGHDFELGCVKPDELPAHRLKGYSSTGSCM